MIPGFLSSMTFLNPWVLAGLILLPALWLLLRVTPPAPQKIVFPATRFLENLTPQSKTTSHTPWWILLLRLITATLIILALSQPILNPSQGLGTKGPLRLIIDNGWESAQNWNIQKNAALDLVEQASRENLEVYIYQTALPQTAEPQSPAQAKALLEGLKPYPWPANYSDTLNSLNNIKGPTYWIATGAGGHQARPLMDKLQSQGNLTVLLPEPLQYPLLLHPQDTITSELTFIVEYPGAAPSTIPVTIEAYDDKGRIIALQQSEITAQSHQTEVILDLPLTLQNKLAQIKIRGQHGAGALTLMDNRFKRQRVGIVGKDDEEETAPLIENSYYIRRALEVYADIEKAPIETLLEDNLSTIIMPDIGALPTDTLQTLEDWTKAGGVLIRFAGPAMTQSDPFLIPVPLRHGGRAMDGSLSWDHAKTLKTFPEHSPLYGIEIPEPITVKRQILAEPIQGLQEKSWALLEDDTPLITADNLGKGLIVLIHTTATPDWSDLALSGTFVQILKRIIALSSFDVSTPKTGGYMNATSILDGFGRLIKPDATLEPITPKDFSTIRPSAKHPPGYYESAGYRQALNLGERIGKLRALEIPASVRALQYGGKGETPLMPYLLLAAFILFLCDWVIMMGMQWRIPEATLGAIFLICTICPATVKAENYADDIYLAYVTSGESYIDKKIENGLKELSKVLILRTSVEPKSVVRVDPETDELSFFPLIYWPVTADAPYLSAKALQKIQHYLDHGGTIWIDTQDQVSSLGGQTYNGHNKQFLQNMIGQLNIPPLVPLPDDHALKKSFYLLDSFPGRYSGGVLWVEEESSAGRDGVSSLIIGSHDWASIWAESTDTHQQELAFRTGVNVMMYALTGNYKKDQIHVTEILKRLGQ